MNDRGALYLTGRAGKGPGKQNTMEGFWAVESNRVLFNLDPTT